MPPNAKIQLRRNLSQRAFYGNRTGPTEHEILCIDVTHHGGIGMHYVTRRYHRMKKHKFGIRCPDTFLVESVSVPHENEK
jgi:hypothetical protein